MWSHDFLQPCALTRRLETPEISHAALQELKRHVWTVFPLDKLRDHPDPLCREKLSFSPGVGELVL